MTWRYTEPEAAPQQPLVLHVSTPDVIVVGSVASFTVHIDRECASTSDVLLRCICDKSDWMCVGSTAVVIGQAETSAVFRVTALRAALIRAPLFCAKTKTEGLAACSKATLVRVFPTGGVSTTCVNEGEL